MKSPLYAVARRLLHAAGYRLKRKGAPVRSYREAFANLQRLGLAPNTVIDVGVADGTPELYASFPQAHFLLVEPLAEYRDAIAAIGHRYEVTAVFAAAGSDPGEIEISVGRDMRKSSVVRRQLKGDVRERRRVPVVTLDALCREHALAPPYVLKIDAEGAELTVLAGATHMLPQTEAIILEVSVWDPHGESPELAAVVQQMAQVGFVVYDVVGAATSPRNLGLAHVDLLFVRKNGRFRPEES